MHWIKRNEVAVFLFLVFALSWWPWPFTLANPESAAMIPWGPMFAAFIVLGLTRGRAGMKSLLADMFRWRVGGRWYVLAFLLPIGVTLTVVYLNTVLGGPTPTGSLRNGLGTFLASFLFITLVGGPFTEEPGWRGFLLPRFQAKYSPLVASLIVGVIWWLWHLPVMVSDPTGQRPPLPFLASILAYSILYTWIYNQTKASVFIITLTHGVTNTIAAILLATQFGEYYIQAWWLYAGLWWVAALFVIFRPGARARATEPVFIERGQDSAI
jgi:uncharacterized protein